MRYIVQFADGSSKRVSGEEGRKLLQPVADGKGIMLRGAAFAPGFTKAVKPINTSWYAEDMAMISARSEGVERLGDVVTRMKE